MPKQTIRIAKAPYGWYGIPYLSILAYPNKKNKQDNFCYAATAGYWKLLYKKKKIKRDQIPDEFKSAKNTTIMSTIRSGINRIKKDRICAAYWAMAKMFHRYKKDSEMQKDFSYTTYKKPKTRIFMTDKFIEMHERNDIYILPGSEKDFDKRMWRSSRPVLHLAIAILSYITEKSLDDDLNEDFGYRLLLYDNSWTEAAIDLAEEIRPNLSHFFPDIPENITIQVKK